MSDLTTSSSSSLLQRSDYGPYIGGGSFLKGEGPA
jgi:hypothetical protein